MRALVAPKGYTKVELLASYYDNSIDVEKELPLDALSAKVKVLRMVEQKEPRLEDA